MTTMMLLGSAAALGAASSLHCVAMCGPLAAVGCSKEGRPNGRATFGYVLGRVVSYSAAGAIVGGLGAPLAAQLGTPVVRIVVAVVVALTLAYRAIELLAGPRKPLVRLRTSKPTERVANLWRRFAPRSGLGLGLVTVLFPCGALLAALLLAAAAASSRLGALAMATYALASAPALVAAVFAFGRVFARDARHLQSPVTRLVFGSLLLSFALWVGVSPLVAAAQGRKQHCHCHEHGGAASMPAR